LINAIYAAVVAYVAWNHELWRDEVRALNIAAGARSIGDLFALLHNEGHPPLWYLLLYAGYRVTHSMLILKPINLLCAIGAAHILLRQAPFPIWQKILFLCGAFPLYEYAVICRNYGISMLLMFAAAALYKDRFSRPLPLCVVLVLLANTNAYSLIIAGTLLVAIVVEALVLRPALDRRVLIQSGVGVIVVVASMIAAVVIMMPDATSTVSTIHAKNASDFGASLVAGTLAAPGALRNVLTGGNALPAHILFWVVTLYFVTRPWFLLTWVIAAVGFSTFSSLVYGADLFQLGLLYILLLVLLWIDGADGEGLRPPAWLIPLRPTGARLRDVALAVLLVTQAFLGYRVASMDLRAPISSSESLGRYLSSSPSLRDAVVIAEPDYMVEALPYYARNRIFLPREGKDMIKINLTTARKSTLSLDELLGTAERLRNETGKPVLLVVHHPLSPDGPFRIDYPYGLEFDYSVESLQRFQSKTTFLTVFDKAASDENYALFQLR